MDVSEKIRRKMLIQYFLTEDEVLMKYKDTDHNISAMRSLTPLASNN